MVKNPPAMQETGVQSLGGGHPLIKGLATRSSILAQSIRWMEEPGGLQATECKELDRTEEQTLLLLHFHMTN